MEYDYSTLLYLGQKCCMLQQAGVISHQQSGTSSEEGYQEGEGIGNQIL